MTVPRSTPGYEAHDWLGGTIGATVLGPVLLHLLGIDHERLTYGFQGRRYRLTDVHRKVVTGILA